MRNLFLFLLFVNLAVFLWNYQQKDEGIIAEQRLQPSVKRLMLRSEIPSASLAGLTSTTVADIEAEVVVQERGDKSLLSDMLSESTEALGDETSGESEQFSPELSQESVDESVVRYCYSAGPITSSAITDSMEGSLLKQGIASIREKQQYQEQAGYWVLIPPQESRAEAIEIVEQLKEVGITDINRFRSGALKHAISLGLFAKRGYAERQSKMVNERGFETIVQPRIREQEQEWLTFESAEAGFLQSEKWRLISIAHPEVPVQTVQCSQQSME